MILFVDNYLLQACCHHISILIDCGTCTEHMCVSVCYVGMRVFIHDGMHEGVWPCQWRHSTNVTIMSQASRGGSLPHLINSTPPLMTALADQQCPRILTLLSPSIYLSVHPSIWTHLHPRLLRTFLYLKYLALCGKCIVSQCQAVRLKGSFLFLSR